MVFFDLSNYWAFLLILAVGYVLFNNFVQRTVGGKNRLFALQKEMQETQKKMIEASKSRREKEYSELSSKYLEQTLELTKLQLKMTVIILVPFIFLVAFVFPNTEPTGNDDISFVLSDDGRPESCDREANDSIYSGCVFLPSNATKGAWTVSAVLKSAEGETIAKSQEGIFVEGGSWEDIWLQNFSQTNLIDSLLGKKSYHLNISTDKRWYSAGDKITVAASAYPKPPPAARYEAVLDSGTFFYIQLPAPLPLLNIRRIIGSTGVFIFFAFLLGLSYSIGRAAYGWAKKNLSK
ncbi:MAG: EMC3/TMCO1 family protein [Candidatus Micrarchaeota archaeon]|nr:EMC3/TMCO1 family protein [Candidatus Micrarchaeota archaeon]